MPRDPLREVAAEGLRLRGWAMGVLAGAPPSPPPTAGPDAWALFLAVERCALALEARLEAAEAVPAPVAEGAMAEAQRVLALRFEAAHLSALLAERGWQGVVLKGGVAALEGAGAVDVLDLDVLVRPEHAAELAAALEAGGHQRLGEDPVVGAAHRHELGARLVPGSVAVELHFALAPVSEGLRAWDGALPLALPGLLRPAAPLHLWHVLLHSSLHHAERRGALRDLLLAAAAAAACSPAELAEVGRRAAAHPRARVLAPVLAAARALREGPPPADAFRREAATVYLLHLLHARYPLPGAFLLPLSRVAYALDDGAAGYLRLWTGAPESALPRGYRGTGWLDRRAPRLATAGRAAWRSAHLAAATLPAVVLARTARRLAADADQSPH